MMYDKEELKRICEDAAEAAIRRYSSAKNLDNHIDAKSFDTPKGAPMSERIRTRVMVNNQQHWITGRSQQELCDRYLALCLKEGVVAKNKNTCSDKTQSAAPFFGDYLLNFVKIYKNKQEALTIINRDRIIRNHILPRLGNIQIDRISTDMIQEWMNDLGSDYAKETLMKIKSIASPALDAAVEDGWILRNPFRSSRLKIQGASAKSHKAIPAIKMEVIKNGISELPEREKLMAALLCYTGMRFEEILGLRWHDIRSSVIYVQRAVVHPDRNKPVVKLPKTETSVREIPVHKELSHILNGYDRDGFVLCNGEGSPLSYSEARRSFQKIRTKFSLEGYSAHDFRDTCATEWRETGMPLDMIARLLGHSKTETTEKRYVKYRNEMMQQAKSLMDGM